MQKYWTIIKRNVFIRYIINGLVFNGIEYSVYYLLVLKLNIHYILANMIISFIIGTLSFLFKNYLVFRQENITLCKIIKYIFNSLINVFAGSIGLYLFVTIINLNFLLSKFFITVLFLFINFLYQKNFIFIERTMKTSDRFIKY